MHVYIKNNLSFDEHALVAVIFSLLIAKNNIKNCMHVYIKNNLSFDERALVAVIFSLLTARHACIALNK
jgi:prolipoprotein diacylglyceryltransferase